VREALTVMSLSVAARIFNSRPGVSAATTSYGRACTGLSEKHIPPFIIGPEGVVYQKDRGEKTSGEAATMTDRRK
jgi:hypothetical protein